MFTKLINSISSLIASTEKKLEQRTRVLAMETTRRFDDLQKTIKEGEYVIIDRQKVVDDREQFLRDNAENQVDQNVKRNTDNNRAYFLLTGVMLIGCILSVKGLKFFFGEFYASVSLLMIIPIALILAGVIVVGSIYLNNFANRYHGVNPFVFFHLKTAAYVLVLFIPSMNLLEGFDSQYRPVVMALNIFGCVVDIVLHTALVSMNSVFITAEISKKSIKILQIKDQAQRAADLSLRSFNIQFMNSKSVFNNIAKQFVSSFKELQSTNAIAASNTLFLVENFTIWMINNKVMQHEIIPYHADENGRPVIEFTYLTPQQDSIRLGWDNLSQVNGYNTNQQSSEILNEIRQPDPLTNGPEDQQLQPQQMVAVVPDKPANESNTNGEIPPDYHSILDDTNPNPNDKVL